MRLSSLGRARAYLAKIPAAVSGAGGHNATFRAALLLVRGFALHEDAAVQLLVEDYNPRCDPPWSEKELRHKVRDAAKKGTPEVGYLLRRRERRTRASGATDRPAEELLNMTEDGRPIIRLGVDIHRVLDEAVLALGRDPDVYGRGARLVTIQGANDLVGPSLAELPLTVLRVRHMSRVAAWQRQGKLDWESCTPDATVVAALHALGRWPGVREVAGIIDTPAFRPDGTAITTPGYDPTTQFYYLPSTDFGEIPASPTTEEVSIALGTLMRPFAEFPFINETARGAYLSIILGRFMRPMYSGPAPGYCVDANNRGVGKGKLIKSACIITTGADAATTPYLADEDAWQKKITALLRSSVAICIVDDVPRGKYLGGWNWNSLLTSDVWQDRLLGQSTIITMRNLTTWAVTGNGVLLLGDMTRRMIHVRLETPHDKPEEIEHTIVDIESHVRESRVELVRAALTLIRAWVVAGRPRAGIRLLGSYESWSAHVGAIVGWLGFGDISKTQEEYAARTTVGEGDAGALKPLLNAWERVFGLGSSVTASHILGLLTTEDRRVDRAIKSGDDEEHKYKDLREALVGFAPPRSGALPSTVHLGRMLNASLKRPIEGRWLVGLGKDRNDVSQFGLVLIADDAGDRGRDLPPHPQHVPARVNGLIEWGAGDAGDDFGSLRTSEASRIVPEGRLPLEGGPVGAFQDGPPHPPQDGPRANEAAVWSAGDDPRVSPADPPHPPQGRQRAHAIAACVFNDRVWLKLAVDDLEEEVEAMAYYPMEELALVREVFRLPHAPVHSDELLPCVGGAVEVSLLYDDDMYFAREPRRVNDPSPGRAEFDHELEAALLAI